ncbi:MAG: choice-of-anchor D domain-containing protein, partial [Candidatus Kapabacteria bacterium]|nr:choice-of-anchor D domain-containing protein [Candidatus Kapabacteria bacterium]
AVGTAVTLVEYSPNNGANWEIITRTNDSSFIWTVPDIETDNLIFRVSQYVESQDESQLIERNSGVCDKVFFAPDNKRLAAVYRDGRVIEWNIETKQKIQTYQLRQNGSGLAQAFGCGFTSPTSFYVAYKPVGNTGNADTVAFFTTSSTTPISVLPLGTDVRYKAALMDSTRASIAMLPVLGSQIDLRNSATGELQRSIAMPSVVNALSLGKDIAVATMLNGRIVIYNLPAWTEQSSVSLPEIPIMEHVLLLPDRNRIAIGCRENTPSSTEGMSAPALIYDIPTKQIVRTNVKPATTTLGIAANATSKVVIFAYKGQPQTPFWDMATNTVSGELTSHAGELTSVAFSDDGRNVASTATSTDNLRVKKFVFPEADISDAPTRIVKPTMTQLDAIMPPTYAFSSSDSIFTANLCNTGTVPVVLGGPWFDVKAHFALIGSLKPDTIQPGGCATITFRFTPSDTGALSDVFNTFMCNSRFNVNVKGYAIPRTLNIPDTIDFGDLCIGGTIEQEITLVRNSDPVPITVNQVQLDNSIGTWFSVVQSPTNQVLAAGGGTTKITMRFTPRDTGIQYRELRVFYGDQKKVFTRVIVRGRGAGTTLQATGSPFVFVPEERERKLVLRNTNNNSVTLTSFDITPKGGFSITPVSVPLTLGPGDSVTTTVRWLNTDSSNARIETTLEPCSTPWNLNITRYNARSTVSIDALQADPNADSATIPINFSTNGNAPYNGERTFATEFSMNPRMFLPVRVSSAYGQATLTRNDIVGDRRIIGIQVRGDFPDKGVAATIHGVAGLAERDTSNLTFNPTSLLWGSAVQTTLRNGSMTLTNLCNDRRITQPLKALSILAIQPNPAQDGADISIRSDAELTGVAVYSPTGEKLSDAVPITMSGNLASFRIDTRTLASGTYTVIARSATATSSTLLVVVK